MTIPSDARDIEAAVHDIFAEALDLEHVERGESFFALGGHSVLVAEVVAAIDERLGIELPVGAFYDYPTIAGVTRLLAERGAHRSADDGGEVPAGDALRTPAETYAHRGAVLAVDGALTYADVTRVLEKAGASSDRQPLTCPVENTAAGVERLLQAIGGRQPTLLLSPDTTPTERRQAEDAFAHALMGMAPDVSADVFAFTSSGSTGRPKIVLHTWRRYLRNVRAFAEVHPLGEDDEVMVTAPVTHALGLNAGLLWCLLAGATAVLVPAPLSPERLREAARDRRISVLQGVPFVFDLATSATGFEVPHLRAAIAGGAATGDGLRERVHQRLGVPLWNHYGSSETGAITTGRGSRAGSAGPVLPGITVGIVTDDGGGPRPRGEGELAVRTPSLMLGYADEEPTRAVVHDGWYHTGDRGCITADDEVVLAGRSSQRINVAGNMVDPLEVEAALRDTFDVSECAVVGHPDALTGESVWAFVVAERPPSNGEIVDGLSSRLSRHKLPTRTIALDALPRTTSGKVDRRALGEW